MLSRRQRVSKSLFNKASAQSAIFHSAHLTLRASQTSAPQPSQFSFVVGKSVSPKAVIRNLIKRRGYSVVGKNLKKIKNSHICLFYFKKGSNQLSFKETEEEINFLLKKSKILDF